MGSVQQDPDEVTTRTELGAALTALRRNADLTVRELARRVGTPSGTLGGYFSGRHVPSNAQLPLLEKAIAECGITDPAEIGRWLDAVRRARTNSDRRVARPSAPYRGLEPYEAEDADRFLGRSTETDEILTRIAALAGEPGPSDGVLAVIGPSGSGKSSLLRAGVAAAIGARALDTPTVRWSVRITTPTGDLTTAFDAPGRSVIIVDQLEELFTSLATPGERRAVLRQLADRPRDAVLVVGMRADFYADAAREPALLAALQHAQVVVGPMNEQAVREVISTPAERAGITIENGLVDLVLADLAPRDGAGNTYDAGALPLLSHALLATWERSNGHHMTVADYRTTGGIEAAVQRTAEDLFSTLSAAEQDAARRLFLRLVHIDESVAVTRRRVPSGEINRLVSDGVDVGGVIDRFVARRLITANDMSVEISHEALLSAWPRLREWVDADRGGLRLHRQLTIAAAEWAAADRDRHLLLRGARLDAAVEWAADAAHRVELDELETEFVESAVRQAREDAIRERHRDRRFRRLLVTIGVLVLLTSALAAYTLGTRSAADREARAERGARDDARSRQVAVESDELDRVDPALAQQLALVAYSASPTPEARSAVIGRSAQPVMTRLLGGGGPTPLAVSSVGRMVAVGDAHDGSVHLYELHGAQPPTLSGTLPGPPGDVTAVLALAFSPNGRTLAVGGQAASVGVWNVSRPSRPSSVAVLPTAFTGATQSIAISPDGTTLAAAGSGKHPVREWNISDPATPRQRPDPVGVPDTATIRSVAFNPSGSLLGAGGTSGVYVWSTASADHTSPGRATVPAGATVDALAFDPTRSRLHVADRDGLISTWDLHGRHLTLAAKTRIDTGAVIDALAVSPDGRQLAVGSADRDVRQLSTSDSRLIATTGVPRTVTGVQYSSDGTRLLATAADGSLRMWQAAEPTIPIAGTAFTIGFTRSGSRLQVATVGDGVVRVWDTRDAATPRPLTPALSSPLPIVNGTGAIRPDGRLLAAADEAGRVELWDLSNPARPRALTPFRGSAQTPNRLRFSPDGNLLAVASNDDTIRMWDVSLPAHPHPIGTALTGHKLMRDLAFSPDGRFVAGANADARVYVWDIRHPARPRRVAALTGFRTSVFGVAFSPNGRMLAGVSGDHTTRLWSMHGDDPPTSFGAPLVGPTNYVYSAAFSPDSRVLAVASDDDTVRLYDVTTDSATRPIATLPVLGGNAYAVAFSPNGRTVVAGGRPGALDLWNVDVGSVARSVCSAAGDPITHQEWDQYVPGARYDPPCRNGRPTS